MFKGFALMDVGVAVTLEKTRPIFVIILAYFFLGERFSLRKSPLIILALLSVYFVAQRNPTMAGFATIELKGVLAMLTASLSFAITAILAKYLSGTSATPTEIVFIRYALATFLLFPVFLFRVELALPYSPDLFEGGIVFFGTFASTLAYVIYYCGLRCVSAGNSSFLQLTTPAVTLALGVVILGENITLSQLAGILGLATAIILIQREEKVKTPSIIPAVERAVIIKRCRA
jgi:drug/metabolite transporter (DMT)-like permease